jgi:ribosomal protein S18 acetylase RimI-like enzyme
MSFANSDIRPLRDADEARECAQLMVSMDPWRRVGATAESSFQSLSDPAKEAYVVRADGGVAGLVVLDMRGVLRGYIQTVCVAPAWQGQGLGSLLVGWAERRIGRESPNVFLCVSSFNPGARRLYERLGYGVVGRLSNYIVAGHDEILLRKTSGPWREFGAP